MLLLLTMVARSTDLSLKQHGGKLITAPAMISMTVMLPHRRPLPKLERRSETANLRQGRSLPSYGIPVYFR